MVHSPMPSTNSLTTSGVRLVTPFKANQPPGAFGGLDLPVVQPRITKEEEPWVRASEVFGADAPSGLTDAYVKEYQLHRRGGKNDADARHRAIRHTQRMGWFKTSNGWKQVLPDLREKINVTEGIQQPDGTYFIEGVPIFHANAVKGADQGYSNADLDRIIANTNASVHSGGSKPVLLEGHPDEIQKAIGKQLDARGFPVNFRKNKKTNMVECDLVKVDPTYMKRLREEKLPAVSAGFAKDAHGLNRRFGHVALLGGTSPALSHLPATEYFSVSGNYLCFSADTESFPRKDGYMLSQKTKDCYAACEAAEKSKELGQPDGDARMKEAFSALKDSMKADFASMDDMGGSADGTAAPMDTATMPMPPVDTGTDTTAAYDAAQNVANDGIIPAQSPMGSPTPAFESFQAIKDGFAAGGDVIPAFNAMVDTVEKLVQVNDALRLKNRANENRARVERFDATMEKLRQSGRHIPKAEILKKQRDACFESRDPDKAMALLVEGYSAYPVQQTPATFNRGQSVFEASDANPVKGTKKLSLSDLVGVKERLTKDDLEFAALSEAVEGD